MVLLPRLGVSVGLAAACAVLGPGWPAPEAHPLAVAPMAGVLVAVGLVGTWPVLAGVLAVVVVGAVLLDTGVATEWLVVAAAPLASIAMARLRRGHAWAQAMSGDALEVLGVAVGAAFLAAALAGALGLSGGWGMAVGLGAVAVAPPLARVLMLLTPRTVPVQAAETSAAPGPVSPPQERTQGLRVLVVEDDPVNRLVALEILRGAGHVVVTAADGLEGLHRIKTAEPAFNAVLLDLHMPNLDGTEVVRQVRGMADPQRANVPILLLSADITPSARRRGLAAGADAFLTKPVEAEALLAALGIRREGIAPIVEPELSKEAAVDLDLLESRLGDLGRDSLGRILSLFQEAGPRHLARLNEHAETGDAIALRREAHTLKGAAAVIGASRVCEAASVIEQAAGDSVRVADALDRLEDIIAATMAAVSAFARRRDIPVRQFRKAPQETSGANT